MLLLYLPLQPGTLSFYWVWGEHWPVCSSPKDPSFFCTSLEDPIFGSFSQEPPGSFQTSLQDCLMQRIHSCLSLPPSAFLLSLSFLPRPICPSSPPSPSPLRSPLFPLPTGGAWLPSLPPLSLSLPLGESVFGAPGSRRPLSPGAA